jgi:hypothetical protein
MISIIGLISTLSVGSHCVRAQAFDCHNYPLSNVSSNERTFVSSNLDLPLSDLLTHFNIHFSYASSQSYCERVRTAYLFTNVYCHKIENSIAIDDNEKHQKMGVFAQNVYRVLQLTTAEHLPPVCPLP